MASAIRLPHSGKALPRIRQLLAEKHLREAQSLADLAMTAIPEWQRHYEFLCELLLHQAEGSKITDYARTPSLTNGIHRGAWNGNVTPRESFVPYSH